MRTTCARPESYYRSIDITNDFMFMTVLGENPHICVALLRIMLPDIKISHVEYKPLDEQDVPPAQPNVQQTFSPGVDMHGVRLDAYYADGNGMYDVEMHNGRGLELPKRSRSIRSAINNNTLKHGADYFELRPCYVIYICSSDPFDDDLYLYTYEMRCVQKLSKRHNDGEYVLYFNANGKSGDVSEPIKEFLKYVHSPSTYPVAETTVGVVREIDKLVKHHQKSPEWRMKADMLSTYWQGVTHSVREEGFREGDRQRQRATAMKLLTFALPVGKVAEATELPLDEVVSIQKTMSGSQPRDSQ
ncbi:MAG: hypothetical protein LBK46_05665 [Oscillospiraceae bacterium]|nr:hypothetical protein [Oscillospiraceae bacterium]